MLSKQHLGVSKHFITVRVKTREVAEMHLKGIKLWGLYSLTGSLIPNTLEWSSKDRPGAKCLILDADTILRGNGLEHHFQDSSNFTYEVTAGALIDKGDVELEYKAPRHAIDLSDCHLAPWIVPDMPFIWLKSYNIGYPKLLDNHTYERRYQHDYNGLLMTNMTMIKDGVEQSVFIRPDEADTLEDAYKHYGIDKDAVTY